LSDVARSKGGRPSLYSEELCAELLERLVLSDWGLEQVCDADDMPSVATVYRWIDGRPEFREDYTRAKERLGELQAGRGIRDAMTITDPQRARVVFDARRWHAGKLNGKYSDRQTLEHTGAHGQPLLVITGVPRPGDVIDGECEVIEDAKTSTVLGDSLPTWQSDADPETPRPSAAPGTPGGIPRRAAPRLTVVGEVQQPDTQSDTTAEPVPSTRDSVTSPHYSKAKSGQRGKTASPAKPYVKGKWRGRRR
jgi:hypothetical protein